MFKAGLAALLIGLLMAGPVPSMTAASPRAMNGSCCCCAPGECHCQGPAKNGPCVCEVQEKGDLAMATAPVVAKPRVSVPLHLLPESKAVDVRPLLAHAPRGQDPPPPLGGHSPQALFRLWLI